MPPATPTPIRSGPLSWGLPALLVAAVTLAYWNSLAAPFLYDDISAVATNPTIHHFGISLTPPADGSTTSGRPVVNFSFAVNYALSGNSVWSYHALNILIHAAAALVLWGLLRRTLASPALRGRFAGAVEPLAFAVALLWALHPLLTESVTFVSQRTESLYGLLCLATLYCFVRGTASPRPGLWSGLSVFTCLTGMATKEVMVTTPLLVLLYDRTFVAGSFAAAWRQRRGYYGALAVTWLLLAGLVIAAGGTRGHSAGLGLGVDWWAYLLKQNQAILLYLKLAVWPHPLVVDYGADLVRSWTEVWWQGPVVLALLAGTVWALYRRPVLGFLGAWFFLILAPSSSVIPLVTQTMAEHRMYLPLIPIVAAVVLGAYLLAGSRSLPIVLALAVGAGVMTFRRNQVYHSELSVWADVLDRIPGNARAHNNLGIALYDAGRLDEAVAQYRESIRLDPTKDCVYSNLCNVLTHLGRAEEAVAPGEQALRLKPDSADGHVDLGLAFARLGRNEEAVGHFETAMRLEPEANDVPGYLASAYFELGNRAAEAADYPAAITRYRQAQGLAPGDRSTGNNLANALLAAGRTDEAIAEYQRILRLHPDDRAVQENLDRARELQPAK